MKGWKWISILIISAGLLSCGKDNPADGGEQEPAEQDIRYFSGTQSPGDFWKWELNGSDKTFTAVWDNQTLADTTDDITISGTFETLPSKFMRMNIQDATPDHPEVPEDGTAFMYGLELPGMALIVKPEGSIKGDVIVNVDRSNCDNALGTYNYIHASLAPAHDLNTEEAYGTVTFSGSTSSISINGTKYSLDCVSGSSCTVSGTINPPPPFACNGDGQFEITENGQVTARGQLTPSGAFMIDNGEGKGGIFGLKSDPSILAPDIGNRNYIGVVIEDTTSFPVSVQFSSDLEASGIPISDVENNTLDIAEAAPFTVTSFGNGLITGFLTQEDKSTGNLAEFEMVGAFTKTGDQRAMGLVGMTNDNLPVFVLLFSE